MKNPKTKQFNFCMNDKCNSYCISILTYINGTQLLTIFILNIAVEYSQAAIVNFSVKKQHLFRKNNNNRNC